MNNSFSQWGTTYYNHICDKCGKPYCYVGDIPQGGWTPGFEPYCTCGTIICKECGQRYTPKCKECGQECL